jgi:hypothetical protein
LEPPRRGFHYRFPTIAKAVLGLKAAIALIDGEAVVLRNDGRSDFYALLTKRGGARASLVAFDPLGISSRSATPRVNTSAIRWTSTTSICADRAPLKFESRNRADTANRGR